MKQKNRFSAEGRQQQQAANTEPLEFESAEDLLRYDADQTPVPPDIARRLSQSVAQIPAPRRPWWRKLFGS